MILRPQPGAQQSFLSSSADIAIYGGAAGGGKSFALILEPLRHVTQNAGFNTVFFRRNTTQVRNPGGLWDESLKIYGAIPGAEPVQHTLEWKFTGGGKIKFAHLEHENTVLDWQGAQIPLICFDELTHFTKAQFWYLLSRNRSVCGVRPYVRATCNPDADSWVAELIAWWIDQSSGLPIPSRAGALRWFVRISDALVWADTAEELAAQYPDIPAKSITFIPARLSDNTALMQADPGYRANLLALPMVDRERLLGGNWKIRPAAGLYFQRVWCAAVLAAPAGLTLCRGWDLAATPETGGNDPDWTCGTLIGRSSGGEFFVLDQVWLRGTPSKVQELILNTASQDVATYGRGVMISIPQDPGQAGKSQSLDYVRRLAGYNVRTSVESRNASDITTPSKVSAKITRFSPFSAQAEAGNVSVLAGTWNGRWFDELEAFPEGRHDDSADSTSRAFAALVAPAAPSRMVNFPFMGR